MHVSTLFIDYLLSLSRKDFWTDEDSVKLYLMRGNMVAP